MAETKFKLFSEFSNFDGTITRDHSVPESGNVSFQKSMKQNSNCVLQIFNSDGTITQSQNQKTVHFKSRWLTTETKFKLFSANFQF